MAKIILQDSCVEFPIYNINARSIKKSFIRLATGGAVSSDANQHIVVKALSSINLTLNHGDKVGLIGHNGAGKSTFLKLLASIYEPTSGSIHIDGNVSPLLSIMQGIESEFTGYDNIIQRGVILGLSRSQIKNQVDDIAELTGLGDYLAMPVRTYSSGMMLRLAFAISTSIKPEILIWDEVFSVGDADFIEKAQKRMLSLVDQSSIVVLASHSDALIKEFCNKALLLAGGCVKYFGEVETALALYHQKN